jgi:hypothetical protein
MDSNASSKKEEDDDPGSHEASPRTSISSNVSNTALQSPGDINPSSGTFTPSRHSIDEIRNLQQLSRQALSRRLSTLSAGSSFGDPTEAGWNWNPREAGINGILFFSMYTDTAQLYPTSSAAHSLRAPVNEYQNQQRATFPQSLLPTFPSSHMRHLNHTYPPSVPTMSDIDDSRKDFSRNIFG